MSWGPTRNAGGSLDVPVVFFDDFIVFSIEQEVSGDTNGAPATFGTRDTDSEWDFVTTGAAVVSDHVSKVSHDGGLVRFTNGGSGGDRCSAILPVGSFIFERDRKLIYETRVRPSSTAMQFFLGLVEADDASSNVAWESLDAGNLDEHVGFTMSADADIEYTSSSTDNTDNRATTAMDFTASGWTTLRFEWDGRKAIKFFVDGDLVARETDPLKVPMDVLMTPTISLRSEGAASTLDIDYVFYLMERG